MLITRELSERIEQIREKILERGIQEYKAKKKGKEISNEDVIADIMIIECLESQLDDDIVANQLLSYISNKYLVGQKNPQLIRNGNY
jgi:hypothetical protein